MCLGSCETTCDGRFLGGTFVSDAVLNWSLTPLPPNHILWKQKTGCLSENSPATHDLTLQTQPSLCPAPGCSSTAGTPPMPTGVLGHRQGRTRGKRFTISDALCQQGCPWYMTLHHKPCCKVLSQPEKDCFSFSQWVILLDLVAQNNKAKQGMEDNTKPTEIPATLQSRPSSAGFLLHKTPFIASDMGFSTQTAVQRG